MSDTPAKAGFLEQVRSFDRTFWIMNGMEMLERLAYYGVRTVLPTYMVLSIANGGPEFDHVQKGVIFSWWALVQGFGPMFTGGFTDRYGYKITIAIAIVLKIVGYILMAEFLSFSGFLTGCLFLAAGTAVFKPGVQGTLATVMTKRNSSVGWGIFYQLVNIGGFLGPVIAGILRLMDWRYVFWCCAAIVSLNLLALFSFDEPSKKIGAPKDTRRPWQVFRESVAGIFRPRIFVFVMLFTGFWFMFNQIFDILPNFLDDWVDSSVLWTYLAATGLPGSETAAGFAAESRPFNQEWLINLNPGLIVLLMLPIAHITGFVTPLRSILAGIAIACLGTLLLGASTSVWLAIGAILVFSVGEMASSPKKMEYLSSLARPGEQGLFMGYANVPGAIGWILGSLVGGWFYENYGDRTNLARQHLVTMGRDADAVAAIPKDDVLTALMQATGLTRQGAVDLLWTTYQPGRMWVMCAAIGFGSLVGLAVYDAVLRRLDAKVRDEDAAAPTEDAA